MERRYFLTLTGVSLAGIAGCTGASTQMEGSDHSSGGSNDGSTITDAIITDSTTTQTSSASTRTPASTANVVIESSELQTEETSFRTEAYVIAVVVNKGQVVSGQVSAKARFYDARENLLSDTMATLPYLKPGETWEVYLPYLDDGEKVKSHRIDGDFERESFQLETAGVSIKNAELQKGDYSASVTGVLVNELDEPADYFATHARLWRNDVIIGGALDNQLDIPAGENWSFEALYSGYGDRWKDATDFDVVPEAVSY